MTTSNSLLHISVYETFFSIVTYENNLNFYVDDESYATIL